MISPLFISLHSNKNVKKDSIKLSSLSILTKMNMITTFIDKIQTNYGLTNPELLTSSIMMLTTKLLKTHSKLTEITHHTITTNLASSSVLIINSGKQKHKFKKKIDFYYYRTTHNYNPTRYFIKRTPFIKFG
jgi:hypothetical protein